MTSRINNNDGPVIPGEWWGSKRRARDRTSRERGTDIKEAMVFVVIKAANGAVEDFRVNGAESEWTVAELKNYLYRHYPTHPVCVYVRVSVAWFSSVLVGPVWWECRTEKQRRRPISFNVASSLYLAHQKPLIQFTARCIPMPDL